MTITATKSHSSLRMRRPFRSQFHECGTREFPGTASGTINDQSQGNYLHPLEQTASPWSSSMVLSSVSKNRKDDVTPNDDSLVVVVVVLVFKKIK